MQAITAKRTILSVPVWITSALFISVGVGFYATPYMGVSTFAFTCLCIGLIHKHQAKTHVPLMLTGISFDLLVVLALELQRSAINTATSFTLTFWPMAHIGSSTIALLIYFPVVYLGWMRLKNIASPKQKTWHLRLGIAAFIFRTIGFVLMFSMLD